MVHDVDEIRSRVKIEEVAAEAGVQLRGGRGPCPICRTSKNSTSFSVRDGRFRCFRCGNHGDVIELVALLTGRTWKETIPLLGEKYDIAKSAGAAKRSKPPVNPQVEISQIFRQIADLRDVLRAISESKKYPPAERADAAIAMVECEETLDFIMEKLPWR